MTKLSVDLSNAEFKRLQGLKGSKTWREFLLDSHKVHHKKREVGRPKRYTELSPTERIEDSDKAVIMKKQTEKPIVKKAEPPKKRYRYYCERCNKQYEEKTNLICDCGGPIRLK